MSSGTNIERLNQNNEILTSNNSELTNLKTLVQSLPAAIDTSDATATTSDILADKTAYVNGEKITGNIVKIEEKWHSTSNSIIEDPNNENYLMASASISTIPIYLTIGAKFQIGMSYRDIVNTIGLLSEMLVEGNTILGVEGTAKLGTPTYESLEALQTTTGSDGDIAVVIDSTNTYIGTYKFSVDNAAWVEIVSATAYDSTLTDNEYNEALTTSNDILG